MNETVLEMHYHKSLMDLFRETFGLGSTGHVNFYKYSPQKECFVGFDQAYAKSQLSEDEFFNMLKNSAENDAYSLEESFVGYFLQFKVVKRLQNITKVTPAGVTSRPHYRAELSTKKNQRSGFSQHELLWNLKSNNGAMVYYACPMIFEKEDLYEVNVDLDRLKLVDVKTSPSAYKDNETHHIYFDTVNAPPVWCSEPTEGIAISPKEFASALKEAVAGQRAKESAKSLMLTLETIRKDAKESRVKSKASEDVFCDLGSLADLLTIARVSRKKE